MTRRRLFYAISHHYGGHVQDRRGRSLGAIVAFPTKAARDVWCRQGQPYQTEPGYREPISAQSAEVQSAWHLGDIEIMETLSHA